MEVSESAERQRMINSGQVTRELEQTVAEGGKTWTTEEMKAEFDVQGFAAPFVVVTRKSDGVLGTLEFKHDPRVYFGWLEDKP
jgi:hypothetical protein